MNGRERTPADAAVAHFDVHSIHTEIEGGPAFCGSFARLLSGWKSDGVRFLTFEELCRTLRSTGTSPVRRLTYTTVPGRATPVTTGGEEA
jgi:hypothetical protein